mmetsp:Transcript_124994/g.312421  ORF Transcript_124994/g.312421 Transcript_124994/m.312421 type:complete len:358 (-) Transcript_124994:100-1173(-)
MSPVAVPVPVPAAWAAGHVAVPQDSCHGVPSEASPLAPPQPLTGEALWESVRIALDTSADTAARKGPLIIFDWDDTIFPTTDLTADGHFAPSAASADQQDAIERLLRLMLWSRRNELQSVTKAAARALREARSVGRVVIVTNAIEGWVQTTAGKFLPDLVADLTDIPVISARSVFEPQGIADAARWKVLCFHRLIRYLQLGDSEAGQIISIGDSWHERAAAFEVAQDATIAWHAKSLKLLERPSVAQIAQQLDVVAQYLTQFSLYEGSLDLSMQDGMVVAPLVIPAWSATPVAQSAAAPLDIGAGLPYCGSGGEDDEDDSEVARHPKKARLRTVADAGQVETSPGGCSMACVLTSVH